MRTGIIFTPKSLPISVSTDKGQRNRICIKDFHVLGQFRWVLSWNNYDLMKRKYFLGIN